MQLALIEMAIVSSNKAILKEILEWLSVPKIFTVNRINRFFKAQTETYLQNYLKEWDLNITAEIPPKEYFKFLMHALNKSFPESFDAYHVQRFTNSIKKRLLSNIQKMENTQEMEQKMKSFLSSQKLTACLFKLATPHQLIDFDKEILRSAYYGISDFKFLNYVFEMFPLQKWKELSDEQVNVFLNLGKEFRVLFKELPFSERDKILSCIQICVEDKHYYNGILKSLEFNFLVKNIALVDVFLKNHSLYERKIGLLKLIVEIGFYPKIDNFVANSEQCEKFVGIIGIKNVALLFQYAPDLVTSIDFSTLNALSAMDYTSYLSGEGYSDKNNEIICRLVTISVTANFPSSSDAYWKYKYLFSFLVNLPEEIFNTITPQCYENLKLKENDELYVKYCNAMPENECMIKYFEEKEITLEEFLSLDGETLKKLDSPLNIKDYIQKQRVPNHSIWNLWGFKR